MQLHRGEAGDHVCDDEMSDKLSVVQAGQRVEQRKVENKLLNKDVVLIEEFGVGGGVYFASGNGEQ